MKNARPAAAAAMPRPTKNRTGLEYYETAFVVAPITLEGHGDALTTSLPTPPKPAVRIVCLNCNIQNELQSGFAVCARCGEPLLDKHIVDMTPKRLRRHLEGNDLPVAILYWSASRYETYSMNDDFFETADYLFQMARFGRVDVDEFPDLAQKMSATHAPQLVLYYQSKEVARWGTQLLMPEMVAWVRANVASEQTLSEVGK